MYMVWSFPLTMQVSGLQCDPAAAAAERRDLALEIDQILAAGHLSKQLVAAYGVTDIGAGRAPPVEQGEAVADDIGVMDVVRDEHHADAAGARLCDQAQHDCGLVHAERGGRLIEDQ